MSTDALREALQNIISAYDEWANNPDPDFGSARLDDAIDRAKGALAAPANETVEELAAKLHDVYQEEAKRQGDPRHADSYAVLPERIKEFDRVLARYILQREAALKADRQGSR